MRLIRNWGIGIIALLLTLTVLGAVTVIWLVRAPFPKTAGTLNVAGLAGTATVHRDAYGVPHIYADTPHDLFFAQGYVHAQDRFWQMEFWRHVGLGRLSEMLGEDLVASDTFIRTIGWNRIAARTLAHYEAEEPEVMAILEAYSDGVNAYLAEHRGDLSLNLTILERVYEPWEIEPWEPLHTLAWGVVMADDLSGNWRDELRRAALIEAVGEDLTKMLLPLYPEDRPVIAPSGADGDAQPAPDPSAGAGSELAGGIDWARVSANLVGQVPPHGWAFGSGSGIGSNSWVIGGALTDTGRPLLANDPHLGVQMPSIWYEVALHAPGWDVAGFSFAGTPGVVIGHNERVAWGVTNGAVDVQDLFIERINPDDPRQYAFEGEWRDVDVIEETIRVNGGEAVTLEVLETHHGPIITNLRDDLDVPVAFQWTAAKRPSTLLKSILLLNQAADYRAFRDAIRYWDTPAQNMVYADVAGNIAYGLPGAIPVRRNGDGLVPVPGWTGAYEWVGWVPFEAMPARFNPPEGFVVTANNAAVDASFPYLLELQWSDGDRAQRLVDLIETLREEGAISSEDVAATQLDSYSLLFESYRPVLTALRSDDPALQEALAVLRAWDGQMRRESTGAALWGLFFMHLQEATLADELGDEAGTYLSNRGAPRVLFHRLAGAPDSPLWDDATTPQQETRDDILLRALANTLDWFGANVGGALQTWQWGDVHTATFVSNPLGQSGIGPVEAAVNLGPFPVDGDSSAVNANGWDFDEPAAVTGHVSMRMIIDVGDFGRSQAVHSTGQSGHPFHPHYGDLFKLWQAGLYHPMFWTAAQVEDAAVDTLVLKPE